MTNDKKKINKHTSATKKYQNYIAWLCYNIALYLQDITITIHFYKASVPHFLVGSPIFIKS